MRCTLYDLLKWRKYTLITCEHTSLQWVGLAAMKRHAEDPSGTCLVEVSEGNESEEIQGQSALLCMGAYGMKAFNLARWQNASPGLHKEGGGPTFHITASPPAKGPCRAHTVSTQVNERVNVGTNESLQYYISRCLECLILALYRSHGRVFFLFLFFFPPLAPFSLMSTFKNLHHGGGIIHNQVTSTLF